MKRCIKCNRFLNINNFYEHSQMKDGHLNVCKECVKKRVRENYRKNFLYYREYEKKRAQTDKRKRCVYNITKRNREKYPQKYVARNKLNNAVRDGKIEKKNYCEICGSDWHVHAHHDDHLKPLDVLWLCRKCHVNREKDFFEKLV